MNEWYQIWLTHNIYKFGYKYKYIHYTYMELDWYVDDNNENSILFNGSSIIAFKTKQKVDIDDCTPNSIKNKKELNVNECFNLNLNVTNKFKLLEILNYLSYVSNNLRTIIRNKNLISGFDADNYQSLLKYLRWLYDACDNIKKHFIYTKRKDINPDSQFKPFKTSSYKFCNFKDGCSIHRHKNKTCDKNHFVFDMVLIDIGKLIESLELITKDDLTNINWIFSDKCLKIKMIENTPFTFDKINYIDSELATKNHTATDNTHSDTQNIYYIDKNTIFKCFDVISYVLNKMYEEASTFINLNIQSFQINL
ncbi:MAG: hypothetical protein Gaeavirus21_3 [Gaeavirus sp.]|uniref:Uncharacterized protein n=1 Tax=Gaeavirus sp. TaxID=2487767 RepID=A0A3G4ZZC2_9VIRU|nr:MAG: hypothetical protein Gaeavirus21_3 [Gaeavirus sp.]